MKPKQTKVGWKKNLDKLLFVFASCYLMIALAWLWKHYQKASLARNNPSSPSVALDDSNLFSTTNNSNDNLSLSLNHNNQQIIEETSKNAENNTSSATVVDEKEKLSSLNPNLPIPVPQPPTPPPLPVVTIPEPYPTISNNNLVQSPLPVQIPPKPRQQSSPSLVSINPSSTPPPIPPKLNQVPVIETANRESEDSLVSSNSSPNYPADGNINNQQNTLVGIVELENNSIALFNLNNLTERVEVGSEIGVTGWVLVGINGKQAILNRYNQSLYLTVGEKF